MGRWLRHLCVLLLGPLALPALAAAAAGASPEAPPFDMAVLHAAAGALDAPGAAAARNWDAAVEVDQVLPFQPGRDAWVRVRLARAPDTPLELQFAVPIIDEVVLFQRTPAGWRPERAGDMVPVDEWPLLGRYPRFRVDAGAGGELLLRVRNARAAPLAVRLLRQDAADLRQHLEYLGLGMSIGALLLLAAPVLVLARVYRQWAFAWYSAYAICAALGLLSFGGVTREWLFGDAPELASRVRSVAVLLAAATNVMLVSALCRTPLRVPRVALTDAGIVVATLLLGVLAAFGAHPVPPVALAPFLALCALAGLGTAALTWRRGDRVGLFALLGNLPLLLVAAVAVARGWGLPLFPFSAHLVAAAAFALGQPFLLAALYLRSRDLLLVLARHRGLASTDAVTGTLAAYVFADRLESACARQRRLGIPSAILHVRLANLAYIQETLGARVAEQSVIRAALKLRMTLRDADTVARLDDQTFGVIFEGALARDELQQRCARLVAHGLMPPAGLQPPVVLQFHVCAWLLGEQPADAQDVARGLEQALAAMTAGTRRPIRFVGPSEALAVAA